MRLQRSENQLHKKNTVEQAEAKSSVYYELLIFDLDYMVSQ